MEEEDDEPLVENVELAPRRPGDSSTMLHGTFQQIVANLRTKEQIEEAEKEFDAMLAKFVKQNHDKKKEPGHVSDYASFPNIDHRRKDKRLHNKASPDKKRKRQHNST